MYRLLKNKGKLNPKGTCGYNSISNVIILCDEINKNYELKKLGNFFSTTESQKAP
jgi:hypothetical protein